MGDTAAGQPATSPCVNAGGDQAANLGLDDLTTRRDQVADTGVADLGFHSPPTGTSFVQGDGDADGDLDLGDFAGLQACLPGADAGVGCCFFDFDTDDDVDLADLADFAGGITGP